MTGGPTALVLLCLKDFEDPNFKFQVFHEEFEHYCTMDSSNYDRLVRGPLLRGEKVKKITVTPFLRTLHAGSDSDVAGIVG